MPRVRPSGPDRAALADAALQRLAGLAGAHPAIEVIRGSLLPLARDFFDADNLADAMRFADGDPVRACSILDAMWSGTEKQTRDRTAAMDRAKALLDAREARARAEASVYTYTIV